MAYKPGFSNGQSSAIVVVMSSGFSPPLASMSAQAAQAIQPSSKRPVSGSLSTNVSGCRFDSLILDISSHNFGDMPGLPAYRFQYTVITS